MEEECTLKYVRPSTADATPHLQVCGSQPDLLRLRSTLTKLGAISITETVRSHCFATFASPIEATAALTAISSPPPDVGIEGKVMARYAGARPLKSLSDTLPLPAVRTAEECGIQGLHLLHEYISSEEEAVLLAAIDAHPWENLARRRVQHYGTLFNYLTRTVDPERPAADFLPEMKPLLARICSIEHVGPLDQLTVNEYPLGVGLSPHIDTHSAFGDTIVALTLAGSSVMMFRRRGTDEQHALMLPPRSLLIMSGPSRLAYEHYIPHRKSDPMADGDIVPRPSRRVSLTFRLVRTEPCRCDFPVDCDDQEGFVPPTRMGQAAERAAQIEAEEEQDGGTAAQKLEDENVNDVYNVIAGHFSATRFAIWPKVREFIESLPSGALVADVGCGNGKYFGVRRDIFVAGSDRSRGLAEVAARRLNPAGLPPSGRLRADVAVADALSLPYRSNSCDGILCIAVLHHISTIERRVHLLAELASVLVPGGRAIVTVWATEQENMKKLAKWQPLQQKERNEEQSLDEEATGQDYLVPWHLPMHRAEAAAAKGATSGPSADVDVGKNALVFQRYYHLFAPGELERLVEKVPGVAVVDCFYDRDNWCVVFQKGRA